MPLSRVLTITLLLFLCGCASETDQLRERAEQGEVEAMLALANAIDDSRGGFHNKELEREAWEWRDRAVETSPEAVELELLLHYSQNRLGELVHALRAARVVAKSEFEASQLAESVTPPSESRFLGNWNALAVLLARGLAVSDPLSLSYISVWDPRVLHMAETENVPARAACEAEAATWFRRAYPRAAWPKSFEGDRDELEHKYYLARFQELLERRPDLRQEGDPDPR